MLTWLHEFDASLFTFLNTNYQNFWLDHFMLFLSSGWVWFGLFALWMLTGIFRWKWDLLRFGGCLLLALTISDVLCFRVLKPIVARTRPCYQQPARVINPGCGSEYGFPSNHAANAMTAATFISLQNPLFAPLATLLAFAVGFSRVYAGVHYPFDVMAGFIVGIFCGTFAFVLFKFLTRKKT